MTRFAFDLLQKIEAVPHESKSFPNPSDTQKRYNEISYTPRFLGPHCKLRILVFPLRFIRAWAINQREKKLGPQYGTDLELNKMYVISPNGKQIWKQD